MDSLELLFRSTWGIYRKRFLVAFEILLLPFALRLFGDLLGSAILLIVAGFFSYVGSFALISAIGKNTSFSDSYRTGLRLFWPAVVLSVLTGLILLGGFFLLIVPGIILLVWLWFADFALVLENRRSWNALSQSREYVRGYWWPIFGRGILLALIVVVAMLFLSAFFVILFGRFAASAALLFVSPFSVAFFYAMYENLRSLKPHVAAEKKTSSGRGLMLVGMIIGILMIAAAIVVAILFGSRIANWAHQQILKAEDQQTALTHASALQPMSGAVGSNVLVSVPAGTLGATTTVFMRGLVAGKNVSVANSGNGQVLFFAIPQSLAPNCATGELCPQFLEKVTPGDYAVSVLMANGSSTFSLGTFTVTTATPIEASTTDLTAVY